MFQSELNLFTGQYGILEWFIIAIVFIYIPCVLIWLKRRKAKQHDYEYHNPQAIKVYIKHDNINDWLRIISVNGEKTVTFTEGIKHGFYLKAGLNRVVVLCQWSNKSHISPLGYNTHSAGDKRLNLIAETGKQYSLCYRHDNKKYVFEEVEN